MNASLKSVLACTAALVALFAAAGAVAQEKKQVRVEPDKKLVKTLRWQIERAATGEKEETRAAAIQALKEAPRIERVDALLDSLSHGSQKVRRFAANELATAKERGAAAALVEAAVKEDDKYVRVDFMRAIKQVEPAHPSVLFTAFLGEQQDKRRLRALVGAGAFKDRAAVPRLVEHMKLVLAGFNQVTMSNITQRAYIADWELISGGTGLVVVEVPDPIIETIQTGVAMEVKVRHVELNYTTAALNSITGEDYGADPGAWKAWMDRNKDK